MTKEINLAVYSGENEYDEASYIVNEIEPFKKRRIL